MSKISKLAIAVIATALSAGVASANAAHHDGTTPMSGSPAPCAMNMSGGKAGVSMPGQGMMMSGQMANHHNMMMQGGMMGKGMSGAGMMENMGMMGAAMSPAPDMDGDGMVSDQERGAHIEALLESYDVDSNGTLSLEEYEQFHSAMMRERMVDRFQSLDNDGDGVITKAEMAAPAARMKRMRNMHQQMMLDCPARGGNMPAEQNN